MNGRRVEPDIRGVQGFLCCRSAMNDKGWSRKWERLWKSGVGVLGRTRSLSAPFFVGALRHEQVSTVGRVIGRSLRIEEISPEQARNELFNFWPTPIVDMLLQAWAAAIGQSAFVTTKVAEITGAPAGTFLDWATDHAAQFRA